MSLVYVNESRALLDLRYLRLLRVERRAGLADFLAVVFLAGAFFVTVAFLATGFAAGFLTDEERERDVEVFLAAGDLDVAFFAGAAFFTEAERPLEVDVFFATGDLDFEDFEAFLVTLRERRAAAGASVVSVASRTLAVGFVDLCIAHEICT